MALIVQTLGHESAMAYLCDVLSQGRSLSHRLLNLDLGKERVWTYLRPDVSVDYAQTHLNETWLVSTEIKDEGTVIGDGQIINSYTSPYPLYIEFIHHFLQRGQDAYCVIEDALRKRSDPYLESRRQEPFAFQAEDVFYVINHEKATPDAIDAGLRKTGAWIQTVVLTRIPADDEQILPGTELTEQQMSAIINNIEAILVAAFDGVGFVVWEKG